MKERKPNGYWSYDNCAAEALKYLTKKEFNEKSPSASSIAYNNGWMNKISTHMALYGNKYKRCVYSYEFIEDKSVYVGLTHNIIERQNGRNCHNTDQVTKHINETRYIPIRKQLTNYIDVETASKLEGECVEKYKNDGWNILNIAKTGGIGGNTLFWTKEKCFEIARQCKSRSEFHKHRGTYSSSLKNGWINEINLILKSNKGPKIIHTKKICEEKALLCKTRKEFKKNYIHEFSAAYKNGWLNDICKHMINGRIYWTEEKCYEASLNCNGRFDFKKKYKGAYEASLKNKWLNKFFK